ncbi:MAG: glycosyltransferase family 2 protein [Chloroflexota bacterium]
MTAPLVSVVTVTLNCAEDALRTARSALEQSFRDFEYLVKDGGSRDGTLELLQSLGVRTLSRADRGVYDAMNQAVTSCRGRFVYFLNAGDVFCDSDVLLRLAEEVERDDAGLFYGNAVMDLPHPYANPSENRRIRRRTSYPPRLGRFFLYRHGICHQAWLARRDLYARDPFDLRLPVMADYDFLLKQTLQRKIQTRYIPRLIAEYQGSGRSELETSQWREDRRKIVERYFSPMERFLFERTRRGAGWVLRAAYRARRFALPGELREERAWTRARRFASCPRLEATRRLPFVYGSIPLRRRDIALPSSCRKRTGADHRLRAPSLFRRSPISGRTPARSNS